MNMDKLESVSHLPSNIFVRAPGNEGALPFPRNFWWGNISLYFGYFVKTTLIVAKPVFGGLVDESGSLVFVGVGDVLPARHSRKSPSMNAIGSELVTRKHFTPDGIHGRTLPGLPG